MHFNLLETLKEHDIYLSLQEKNDHTIPLTKARKQLSSKELLENTTLKISRYCNHAWAPSTFIITNEWCYLSELLRTDGHIAKNQREVKLVNTDKTIINKFLEIIKKAGIVNIRYEQHEKEYRVRVFDKTFAVILTEIFNIQPGNKSLTTRIPIWMKSICREKTKHCLRGAFDGDGSVQHSKGGTRRIRLNTGSKHYAEDVKQWLQELGIASTIFPDQRREGRLFYLQISKKEDIGMFSQQVNFNHTKRKEKLQQLVTSYKREGYGRQREIIFDHIKDNPRTTCTAISKAMKLSESTVSSHLKRLERQGSITKEKRGQRKLITVAHRTPCAARQRKHP